MASATITLTVGRGDTLEVNATHVVSSTDVTVVNISGWTIAADVRQHLIDGAIVLSLTCVVVSGAAGTYTFTLTHTQTMALPPGIYAISVFRTDTGSEREMATGTLTIVANARYGS